MVNTRQSLGKAGSCKLRCESKVGGKWMRCQLHAQELFRQYVWMNIIVLPYNELLFVTWHQGKDSCNCLLLQSAMCKTLLEEDLPLICGNVFEESGNYPWFNWLGTVTYLMCNTLISTSGFEPPPFYLLGSMPVIRFQ